MTEEPAPDLEAILNLGDFEEQAAARLELGALDYIRGGAGEELTLADNERAFRRYRLRPRVLVDVSTIDTATTFLGQSVALPVGTAPMAFQHFAHPDAERATARAAAHAGALFCLSTMSSRSIEEVAAAAGYSAIVLTVDLPVAGVRERDVRNRFGYPQVFGNFGPRDAPAAGEGPLAAVIGGFNDASLSWTDVDWLRGLSDLPMIVKGVLTPEDATLAVAHGAAAVVVSNHGGRQLDRTPATIDVLAEIVDASGGDAEVYLDGGVRRGVDVLTALALGARGVLIGRPLGYALAVGGEAGVARALGLIEAEVRTDMALLGVTRINQLTSAHVRRA